MPTERITECPNCKEMARELVNLRGRFENLQLSLVKANAWLPRSQEEDMERAKFLLENWPERYPLLQTLAALQQAKRLDKDRIALMNEMYEKYDQESNSAMLKLEAKLRDRQDELDNARKKISMKQMEINSLQKERQQLYLEIERLQKLNHRQGPVAVNG